MRKGTHHCESTKRLLSEATKRAHSEGRCYPYFKGKKIPAEVREKISKTRQGQAPWNKGLSGWMSAEHKAKWARWGVSPSNKGKSMRHKGSFQLGHTDIAKNKGRKRTEEQKEKISNVTREMWKESEFVAKQMRARRVKPNKQELLFDSWLQANFPGEWKYVGDGRDKEFIIGGKCPDWGHRNGYKKLIELFGDYWHQGEDPQEKIGHYRAFGYETLVIWEYELCGLSGEELVSKIEDFTLLHWGEGI